MERCPWSSSDELMVNYHDTEWGVPVHDDNKHFEFLVLEAAQAGLSWMTVLKKREAFRDVYSGFDPLLAAQYDEEQIERMLNDARIIRNGRKIRSSINNAKRFLEVQREFGRFDDFLWGFVDHKPVVNGWSSPSEIPARTALSDRISKELIRRGFSFVGSTIIYAHLQAAGLVNDHVVSCFRYGELTCGQVQPAEQAS
jgi:DNA-3-methyladenine glycosylase I